MIKEQMLSEIYEKIANKELTFGCKILGRYGQYESQLFPHVVSWIVKIPVRVREWFFYSYEDIVEIVTTKWNSEFFFMESPIHEKMYNKVIRNNRHFWQSTRLHRVEKIIGHPVYIWNVLDYNDQNQTWLDWKDKKEWREINSVICMLWHEKRKPIDDQSEECITYIHSLIK